jgi:hypothetical protein
VPKTVILKGYREARKDFALLGYVTLQTAVCICQIIRLQCNEMEIFPHMKYFKMLRNVKKLQSTCTSN